LFEIIFKGIGFSGSRTLARMGVDQKRIERISANPNPKAQKRFQENKMASFFGQAPLSKYRFFDMLVEEGSRTFNTFQAFSYCKKLKH